MHLNTIFVASASLLSLAAATSLPLTKRQSSSSYGTFLGDDVSPACNSTCAPLATQLNSCNTQTEETQDENNPEEYYLFLYGCFCSADTVTAFSNCVACEIEQTGGIDGNATDPENDPRQASENLNAICTLYATNTPGATWVNGTTSAFGHLEGGSSSSSGSSSTSSGSSSAISTSPTSSGASPTSSGASQSADTAAPTPTGGASNVVVGGWAVAGFVVAAWALV